jgi:hypothetical protein
MDKLKRALERNELYQYFTGEGEYYFHPSMADLPTDPVVAFQYIELYYDHDPAILEEVQKTLLKMSEDTLMSWFSLYYLYALLTFCRAKGITTDLQALVKAIEYSLEHHRPALTDNRSFEGGQWKNGLWGDVTRVAMMIKNEFGFLFSKVLE